MASLKTITIEVIDHDKQRYPTVGDWVWSADGRLTLYVSSMDNWRYEFLVAFHELAEVMLCRARSIPQSAVDEFDIAFEARRVEGNTDEPGDDPRAPYRKEHAFATCLERLMATELGVDWREYDKKVSSL